MERRTFLRAAQLALLPLFAACASDETVKAARGQGVKRVFKQAHDDVFAAAVAAAEKRQLEVVSSDRDSGTIVLNSRPTFSSIAGERISIFVARLRDRTTSVEIVSRATLAVSLPRDWPVLLFGEIEEELATRRLKR